MVRGSVGSDLEPAASSLNLSLIPAGVTGSTLPLLYFGFGFIDLQLVLSFRSRVINYKSLRTSQNCGADRTEENLGLITTKHDVETTKRQKASAWRKNDRTRYGSEKEVMFAASLWRKLTQSDAKRFVFIQSFFPEIILADQRTTEREATVESRVSTEPGK